MNNDIQSDFFNRCEYDQYPGKSGAPIHRIYLIRNYGGGESCVDACAENIELYAPDNVEVVCRRERGKVAPHTIDFVHEGAIIRRFTNFVPDERTYSAEELIANPDLLPNHDIEGFKRHYGIS